MNKEKIKSALDFCVSMRDMLVPFAFEQLDYLTEIIARKDKDVKIAGYPAMADHTGFSSGSLIQNGTMLYLQSRKNGDLRQEVYKDRMLGFFDLITEESTLDTWGKLSTLVALRMLSDNGVLDCLSESKLALLKKKTEYSDFLDKETLEFKKALPFNYYHVALHCAGIREILGFEKEGMSDRIADKMFGIMQSDSNGWEDELPPHGLFDGYSVGMSYTLCNMLEDIGKPVPKFLKENLQESIHIFYEKRNRAGNGFAYGRSLSFLADMSAAKHMVYGLTHGMLKEEQRDEAVMYCLHIVEKMLNFWFIKEERSCNIWFDGRSTEEYRGVFRILEVNVGFAGGLLALLETFEKAGLADYVPEKDIVEPTKWEWHKTTFVEVENKARAMYVLRRGSHSFMLPLIGLGISFRKACYMPFAAEPQFTEAPPADIFLPFLTPEVILKNGDIVRPIEFFESITETAEEDKLTITVKGHLCKMNCREPRMSEHEFTTVYCFNGNRVTTEFFFENVVVSYIMYAGKDTKNIKFLHVQEEKTIDVSENKDFHTPHGALKQGILAVGYENSIGYEITLS